VGYHIEGIGQAFSNRARVRRDHTDKKSISRLSARLSEKSSARRLTEMIIEDAERVVKEKEGKEKVYIVEFGFK